VATTEQTLLSSRFPFPSEKNNENYFGPKSRRVLCFWPFVLFWPRPNEAQQAIKCMAAAATATNVLNVLNVLSTFLRALHKILLLSHVELFLLRATLIYSSRPLNCGRGKAKTAS